MKLQYALQAGGGIMRVGALLELGFRREYLRKQLLSGQVVRPRHGWLALPDADQDLVYAVRHGALLSCMTVVARRKLWVPRPLRRPHLAARTPQSPVLPGDHVCHWGVPVLRREPGHLEDRLENALVFAVGCLSVEEALAVWESALRRGETTRAALERLPLRTRERRLLAECTQFSDSGLESYVRRRLRSLRLRLVAQAWVLGHRVDFLIEDWLVLQIDGGHHVGAQRDADNRLDALLAVNGYLTIRVGSRQVDRDWPEVQRLIMLALSQGPPHGAGKLHQNP